MVAEKRMCLKKRSHKRNEASTGYPNLQPKNRRRPECSRKQDTRENAEYIINGSADNVIEAERKKLGLKGGKAQRATRRKEIKARGVQGGE